MRNPKRIPVVLNRIKEIWEQYPDLRLGQFLVLGHKDIFLLEDDDLIFFLEEKYFQTSHIEIPDYWVEPNAWRQMIDDMKTRKFSLLKRMKAGSARPQAPGRDNEQEDPATK